MKTFFLSILLFIILSSFASEKAYTISVYTKDIGENQTEYQYYLVNHNKNDSLLFVNTIRRDLPPPIYFWSENQAFLIFESDLGHGLNSKIKILETHSMKIIETFEGCFHSQIDLAKNFFDSQNQVLFYFEILHDRLDLKMKKISTMETSTVHSFKCFAPIEKPLLKLDTQKKQLLYQYSCQESKTQQNTFIENRFEY